MKVKIIALICITGFCQLLLAQDDSRISFRTGYATKAGVLGMDDVEANQLHFAVERFLPMMNSGELQFGIELNRYDIQRRIISFPNVSYIDDETTTIGVYVGASYYPIQNVRLGANLNADYDVQATKTDWLGRLNGLGGSAFVEYEIHVNDSFVLSVGGFSTLRSMLQFKKKSWEDEFYSSAYAMYGGHLMLSYKFY